MAVVLSGRTALGGRPRWLLPVAPLVLVLAAAAPAAAGGRDAAAPPPLDPAVARCVLAELGRARTGAAVGLLYDACESLVGSGGGPAAPADPSALLECRVPTGPEWARVRLLTRRQCAAAGGRVAAAAPRR